ncbi:MAG: DUF4031 domain-containing protein [Novosphingobium sp.]|nr:DUF4031 domain-containing protein [Novosphingobium sp.]
MVYVDDMNCLYGRMIMCHLFADTIEELHKIADKIQVNRKWFQTKNKKFPHYDICLSKKKLAIQEGAVEVRYRDIPKLSKKIQNLC